MTTQDQIKTAIRKEGVRLHTVMISAAVRLATANVSLHLGHADAMHEMCVFQEDLNNATKDYTEYLKTNGLL